MLTTQQAETILNELKIKAIRSSGPGGQHVNKTSTRIEIRFNLTTSSAFNGDDKLWLFERLKDKLTQDGDLIVSSQSTRSQFTNKEEAKQKLLYLIEKALHRPKSRKATKPSGQAKAIRIENKRRVAEKKKWRQRPDM